MTSSLSEGTDQQRVVWAFGPENVTEILRGASSNPQGQDIGGHAIYSSPVLSPDGKSIYFVGYSAFLIALDASNGGLKWISSEHNYTLGSTVNVDVRGKTAAVQHHDSPLRFAWTTSSNILHAPP